MRMGNRGFLPSHLYDAGAVVGVNDVAGVEVSFAVGDVDCVALAQAQHPDGMTALFGVEGAETLRGYIFTIK